MSEEEMGVGVRNQQWLSINLGLDSLFLYAGYEEEEEEGDGLNEHLQQKIMCSLWGSTSSCTTIIPSSCLSVLKH